MKSYLKFLSRNKLYTAIEAVGLAVSLAFVILIGSYVVQQYQVAHGTPDWKRTFVLGTNEFIGLTYWDKEELEMNIPEVEAASRFILTSSSVLSFGGEMLSGETGTGMAVDPDFFRLFPESRLLEGSLDAFQAKDAVLLGRPLAQRLQQIEEGSLVGKSLRIGENEYVIAGIVGELSPFFSPVDLLSNIAMNVPAEKAFNSVGSVMTMFRVRKDTPREELDAKVSALLETNYGPVWGDQLKGFQTWRMDELFFCDKVNGMVRHGNRMTIRLLSLVVILLLLSAIFNYVNLSLALSGKRAREMAMRRLLGEDRSGIVRRQISESILFTAVCFVAALVLAWLLVPTMNDLLSTQEGQIAILDDDVKLRFALTPGAVFAYLSGILLLGTLCGLLPAWISSRYKPVEIIKGMLRRNSKMVFSKVFIIAQHVLSVLLIALALVMEMQMKHMAARPTHSQVANRYYLEFDATGYDQMKLLKDKVEQMPFVGRIGIGRGLPGMISMVQTIKMEDESRLSVPVILCDTTYFDLLGLEVLEDFHHPRLHSIWLGETAFRTAQVSDSSTVFPRKFGINGARAEYIGGIFKDIPTRPASADDPGDPHASVIVSRPEELFFAHCLLIETVGEENDYQQQIMAAYHEYRKEQFGVEDQPWRYGFLRDLYRMQLEPVRRTVRLMELFMLLSVLISLLGLLAMSTYFADENTKQIAVRKVFGSDVTHETWRNVRSYMILVGVACLIGIPLAVWAARLYLERFAYRIEGYGWVFVLAVAISLAIAFGTVLWQVLKAAKTNPAVELKKE